MVDLSQFTLPRVMAGLAVLSVIGWVWAIADSDIPASIGILLCAVAPVALLILALYWVNERLAGEPPYQG